MSLKQSPTDNPTSPLSKEHVADCWRREPDHPCLRVEANSGEAFLFPYHQLQRAHYVLSGETETLTIFFATHEVAVSGKRLSEIAAALQDLAIRWIKPVHSRYRSVAQTAGASVAKIEVTPTE